MNDSVAGWGFIQEGTSPGPRLTAGAAPVAADPEFGGAQIDVAGQGWLRLATTAGDQSNAAYLKLGIPANGTKITFEFDFAFWDDQGGNQGGDGIAVFLADANVPFSAGAFGGSLGYAQKTGIDGVNGGYVGVGLDVYGNYSNPTEGRVGGPGFSENEVAIRGPGNGTTGYDYVAGTADTPGGLDAIVPGPNNQLDFPTYTERPDQDAADYRHATVIIDENNLVTVQLQFGFGTTPYTVLSNVDLSSYGMRPDEFVLGFTAGTGGANQVYEIRNLSILAEGGADNYYWDNGAGTAPGLWGTGMNWDKDTVPTTGATVFFTDQFAGTDADMTVQLGADRTVNSVFFNGRHGYTLTGNTLIFDSPYASDTSRILVLHSPNGDADHTIASNTRAANDLVINHFTDTNLTLSGDMNLAGNDLVVDADNGSGATIISGAISNSTGTSTITKDGNGTLVLSGSNTYGGATAVNNGVLEIRHGNALGTTAAGTTVAGGATLALSNNITVGSEALTISGTGEGGRGALVNAGGNNTWQGAVTMTGAATFAAEAGDLTIAASAPVNTNGNALTLDTDSGASLTINGSISDGAGSAAVTKTGLGTATLGGNNTYDGLTTVAEGTLVVTNGSGLGSTASGTTVSSGATLGLSGGFSFPAGEALTLSGQGAGSQAALWNLSGSNTWQGAITLTGGGASVGASAVGQTLTLNGVISGAGQSLTVEGPGTVLLGASNTYTGPTNITAGTLQLGGSNRINDNSAVVMSSGSTLNLNNFNETVGSLAGTGGTVSLGNGALTIGGDNTSTTWAGAITGAGPSSVTKTGAGTWTVTGANTFAGDLIVTGGTVALGADNVFNAATDLVLNGGAISTAGFDQTFNSLNRAGAGTIDFLSTAGSILTFGSTTGAGALAVNNWAGSVTGGGGTQFDVTSAAAPGTAGITFTGWGAGGATVVGSAGNWEIVPDLTGVYRWDGPSGQTWVSTNTTPWVGAVAPPNTTPGTAVYFGDDAADAAQTVVLTSDRTVGTMILNGTGNRAYTFNGDFGGGDDTIVFDQTGTATAYLTVGGSQSHVIGGINPNNRRVDVDLNDDLLIQNNSSAATGLTFGTAGGAHTFDTDGFTVTIDGSSGTVIHSQITDTGAIVKNGTGILELTDNNTFSGGVTLNSGTIQLGNDGALGTGTFTINGGTIEATGGARTVDEALAINGSFTVAGANDITFNRTGTSTVGIGQQTVTINAGRTVLFDAGHDLIGTGGLVKDGAGTMEFRGDDSTFSGGLTVNAGTVNAGTNGTPIATAVTLGGVAANQNYLGAGNITVNGGTLNVVQDADAALTIAGGSSVANTGGTLNLTNQNAGFNADFALNGALATSGGTTTVAGIDDLTMGAGSVLSVSGGSASITLRDDFTTAGTAGNRASISVSGSGSLTIDSTNGAGGVFQLGAADQITVDGPTATMGITMGAAADQVNLDGTVTLNNGAVLEVTQGSTRLDSTTILDGGTGATKGTLSIAGNLSVNNPNLANSPNITINAAANTVIQPTTGTRSLSGVGTLTKTGPGTTTVAAGIADIEADRIIINGGTLLLGASDQINNNTDMTLAGGTFATGGNSEVLDTLTLSSTSTINVGAGSSILQFSESSAETWNLAETLFITNWSGNAYGGGTDQIYFGSTFSGLTANQIGRIVFVDPFGGGSGTYGAQILSTGEIVPIPEPSAIMAAAVLVGAVAWRERRRLATVLAYARAQAWRRIVRR